MRENEDRSRDDDSDPRVSLFPDMKITAIGLDFEQQAAAEGFRFVAGVDEVGRGCLAGAVVAAACILDPAKPLPEGLNDSKQIPQEKREEIAEELKQNVIAWAVGQVEAEEIDRINILQATKKAMRLAIEALQPKADFLLIDAVHAQRGFSAAKSDHQGRFDLGLDRRRQHSRQNISRQPDARARRRHIPITDFPATSAMRPGPTGKRCGCMARARSTV